MYSFILFHFVIMIIIFCSFGTYVIIIGSLLAFPFHACQVIAICHTTLISKYKLKNETISEARVLTPVARYITVLRTVPCQHRSGQKKVATYLWV